jgi:hypothetical protein
MTVVSRVCEERGEGREGAVEEAADEEQAVGVRLAFVARIEPE